MTPKASAKRLPPAAATISARLAGPIDPPARESRHRDTNGVRLMEQEPLRLFVDGGYVDATSGETFPT